MANTTNIDLVKPAGTDYALVSVLNSNFDKIDAEAGKVRANFAGTYSTSSAYAVGAYCIYQGNLYRCKTAIGSGGEAWTSGHWDQVSVGTELTTLNNQIANVWNATKLAEVDSSTTSATIQNSSMSSYRAFLLVLVNTGGGLTNIIDTCIYPGGLLATNTNMRCYVPYDASNIYCQAWYKASETVVSATGFTANYKGYFYGIK